MVATALHVNTRGSVRRIEDCHECGSDTPILLGAVHG